MLVGQECAVLLLVLAARRRRVEGSRCATASFSRAARAPECEIAIAIEIPRRQYYDLSRPCGYGLYWRRDDDVRDPRRRTLTTRIIDISDAQKASRRMIHFHRNCISVLPFPTRVIFKQCGSIAINFSGCG